MSCNQWCFNYIIKGNSIIKNVSFPLRDEHSYALRSLKDLVDCPRCHQSFLWIFSMSLSLFHLDSLVHSYFLTTIFYALTTITMLQVQCQRPYKHHFTLLLTALEVEELKGEDIEALMKTLRWRSMQLCGSSLQHLKKGSNLGLIPKLSFLSMIKVP